MADSRETQLTETFVTLADTLVADYDLVEVLHTLVTACIEIVGIAAGGLLIVDGASDLQLVASTSEDADLVELMQLSAGKGPCLDCFRTGAQVSVANIDRDEREWPEFRRAALQHGFHSVHAVPMRLRDQVIGTMNLFGSDPGPLTDENRRAAQALADVATIGILQQRSLRDSKVVAEQLQRALTSRVVIEQAKGVLSQARSISVEDAFDRLRRYARSTNAPLHEVALAVVQRRLDPAAIDVTRP